VSNLKALECARGKRLDPATQQYVFGYEEALALARKPLARKYGESDVVYFEKQIDRFMDELLEDPARAIAKRFLADNSLDSEIRNSLANAPTETATPDTPERLLLEIKRKQGTLNRIAAKRFHKGHTQTVAVPDGNGSYFIDTVGTPGRWEVFLTTGDDDRAAAASVTRLLDALCDIFLGNTPPTSPLERGFTGEDDQVVIVEDVAAANGIAVEHLGSGRLRLYLASRLLELSRADLRALLRDAFATLEPAPGLSRHNHDWEPAANGTRLSKIPRPCGVGSCSSECHSGFVATRTPAATQEVAHNQRPPGVVMLDFSGTSGPYLVAHALEMKGIPAQVIKPGGKITLERPAIFCISLATQPLGFSEVGEHIKTLREFIDEHFPGSFIILGGPSAKHPKAAIALLPEINILLRGEGEEVLPEVVRIIGATRLTDGLNRKQIDELKQIDGLFLHTPGFIMLNNLNEVNAPADFDVPVMFHYGSFSLFGGGGPIASRTIINPDIARGCPFRCSFCSMAMGWNQRYVELRKLQNYVLGMLALELPWPGKTQDAIAAALQSGGSSSTTEPRDEWFPADTHEFSKDQLAQVVRILDRDLSRYLSARGPAPEKTRLFADDDARELARSLGVPFADVAAKADAVKTDVLNALVQCLPATLTRGQVNEFVIVAGRRWLQDLLEKGEDLYDHGLDHKLEILLEDDNTLCNREYIEAFCRWVIDSGLHKYLRFGAGQTSVSSFLRQGRPNEDFIRLLREAGCREVEMGVDGLSNNVLKQNGKRGYRLGDAIRVVRTLTKWGIDGASNRLYSAPYASRLDVVESLLLGALAPLGGHSLGGAFIITVPGSEYANELAVNYPDRAADRTCFEQTYGPDYEYAWTQFPEYVPLEHHLYPYAPEAREITEKFGSLIKIRREDKHIYDAQRKAGSMEHELGILTGLESEGLETEIEAVISRCK